MTVLEIIAEQRLGRKNLNGRPRLRASLNRIDRLVRQENAGQNEQARIASIVELCFACESEGDVEEKANILRTIEEISANEPLELAGETVEEWESDLRRRHRAFAKAQGALEDRSCVAVIESGAINAIA